MHYRQSSASRLFNFKWLDIGHWPSQDGRDPRARNFKPVPHVELVLESPFFYAPVLPALLFFAECQSYWGITREQLLNCQMNEKIEHACKDLSFPPVTYRCKGQSRMAPTIFSIGCHYEIFQVNCLHRLLWMLTQDLLNYAPPYTNQGT